jgi:hypothetical protein
MGELNAELKDMENLKQELRMKIKYKQESRDVWAEPRPNFQTNMMEYYDTTSGEMLMARHLLPEERQMRIVDDVPSLNSGSTVRVAH